MTAARRARRRLAEREQIRANKSFLKIIIRATIRIVMKMQSVADARPRRRSASVFAAKPKPI